MRLPPPLRYTIPALIVVFGSLAGLSSFLQEINESYRIAEQTASVNLRTSTAQTSRVLEYLYRSSDSENQIKTLVSQLGSYPGYMSVMVLGDNNKVEESNDYRQKGAAVSDTLAGTYSPAISTVRQKLSGSILTVDNKNKLISISPVLLASRAGELRPSRVGILFVEYDLKSVKHYAFNTALRRALISNASLIAFCLLIWLFFEFALNKRIQRLVEASNNLGEGKLDSRSVLTGSDELAQVSAAFDSMAEKMQNNSVRLERQARKEQLLREINDRIRISFNLEQIFETATFEVLSYLQADRVAVYQFAAGTDCRLGRFIAVSSAAGICSILDQEVEDTCFTPQLVKLYLKGRANVIDDIKAAKLTPCYRELLERYDIRSSATVPLVHGHELWGLLCVHQCRDARKWSDEELAFIRYVAVQLAIAIQQSILFTKIETELRDRRLAEERLIQANHQLEETNDELARATRLKDEFLANMSHELRTPLNAILGMAESMSEGIYGDLPAPQSTAVEEISKSGAHLLDLINDILDITKIEAGKLEVSPEPSFVSELCESCFATAQQLTLAKSITLHSDIQPDIPCCLIDPKLLRQILINLLSNAVKFTPVGGQVSMRAVLEPSSPASNTGSHLAFEVRDSGIGVAPENRDKVFMPFVQVQSSLNRQFGGTGLGLSIVKKIVEAQGGSIVLDSELGKGSHFRVVLPYHPASAPQGKLSDVSDPSLVAKQDGNNEHQKLSSQGYNGQSKDGIRVLLAEDNRVNSLIYTRYLKSKGFDLLHATNGQEAVDMAMNDPVDVIVLDMSMPILDGFEVMQKLRSSTDPRVARIPIIAFTAMAMKGDRERCLAAGANEYLTKPVKLNQLDITIKHVLSNGESG
ncbi:ATP-binding protein [Synechococcus sp. CCY9201]|uniref:ATP-binding protein n=1 Tax=Synechococcus sp. CCY9201 TaxID=174697 RepID=UPI002B1F0907|nr:ATP-binding protein [Synechococcus sp. CCY9201]MEA5475359.1 ATP-binding protein [Synechococcus sp. CCY9201]